MRRRQRRLMAIATMAATAALVVFTPALDAQEFEILFSSGDNAPSTGGTFGNFSGNVGVFDALSVNANGVAVFMADVLRPDPVLPGTDNLATGIFEHARPKVGEGGIFLKCLMVLAVFKTFEATASKQTGDILVDVIIAQAATHVYKAVIVERTAIGIQGIFGIAQLIDE